LKKKFPFESYGIKKSTGEIQIFPRKKAYLYSDDLPSANWDYLNIEKYFIKSGDTQLPIEAGRGCPYNYTYCCSYLTWGKKLRQKNPDILIKEIIDTYNSYGKPSLYFADDNISFNKQWIVEFLTKLKQTNDSFDLLVSNFSVKHLDEEILNLLIDNNMNFVSIAIESGTDKIQRQIRKRIDFSKAKETIKLIKSKNFIFHIQWMLGFPNETIEDINATIELARELKAHHKQLSIVTPYPGTQLYNEAKDQGILNISHNDIHNFNLRKSKFFKSSEWDKYPLN